MTQENSIKRSLCIFFCAAAILWILWTILAAWLTGPVISDSWQSIGPAVKSRYPFDLSGLFLGDFDGYNRTWGHHWPGWAMLASLVFSIISFHSVIVFFIEAIFVLLSALLVYHIINPRAGLWLAILSILLVLLDPGVHVAISMMRPEPLTGFLFLLLSYLVHKNSEGWPSFFKILFLSLCLPMTHVIGCVATPILVIVELVRLRHSPQSDSKIRLLYSIMAVVIGWLLGCCLLALWFFADTDRLHHFTENLTAQRLSSHGLWNSFRVSYLTHPAGILMLVMLTTLAILMFRSVLKKSFSYPVLLYGSIPLVTFIFLLLAHNPNRIHLTSVYPCLIVAMSLGINSFSQLPIFTSRIQMAVISLALLVSVAFQAKRALRFVQTPTAAVRASTEEWIDLFQGDYKLYLPMSLWEAAATTANVPCLFYTFPNVAHLDYRLKSEKSLLAHAKIGDILIFDVTQNHANHDYFFSDALIKLRTFDPYALGDIVETRVIKTLYGDRVYQVIKITDLPTHE